MSITSALTSALSGLSVTSRQAEILSSNVANARTPGYARRALEVRSAVLAGTGQGVAAAGVTRNVDRALLAERRLAQANESDRSLRSVFLERFEKRLGSPDEPGSLASRLASFDQALTEARGRPDSQARLQVILSSAKSLASGFKAITDDIQSARHTADRQIAEQVGQLNSTLSRLKDLNAELRSFSGVGRDVSALLDERQRLVDSIAPILPVVEVRRENDQIALFTTGGAALLEGNAATVTFTPTNTVTPEMTQALGGLSGLMINGDPVPTAGSTSPFLGGSLAALFAVRDELAVEAQGKVDAVARDLVERFQNSGLDPSRALGAPGLFTDDGATFVPADEIGLAGRISLNAAVDPSQGGAIFRLRDGLGASVEGPDGNASHLTALQAALTASQPLASTAFPGGTRNFSALIADLHAGSSAQRLSAEADTSFANARLTGLTDLEAQNGIDTDQEMQELLVIEKNYAANAKVIQSVQDMLDILIRLGA